MFYKVLIYGEETRIWKVAPVICFEARTILAVVWREKETRKTSLRVAGRQAEILTRNLLNANLELHHYTILLNADLIIISVLWVLKLLLRLNVMKHSRAIIHVSFEQPSIVSETFSHLDRQGMMWLVNTFGNFIVWGPFI
jgi:hypothetical protein